MLGLEVNMMNSSDEEFLNAELDELEAAIVEDDGLNNNQV